MVGSWLMEPAGNQPGSRSRFVTERKINTAKTNANYWSHERVQGTSCPINQGIRKKNFFFLFTPYLKFLNGLSRKTISLH